jgi:hypothetical protein
MKPETFWGKTSGMARRSQRSTKCVAYDEEALRWVHSSRWWPSLATQIASAQ